MAYVFLILGLAAFLLAVRNLGIVAKVTEAVRQMRQGMAVMSAAELSDRAKERALQRAALRAGGLFVDILACSITAVVAAIACLFVGSALGLFHLDDAVNAAQNPLFLLFLTMLGIAAVRFAR